MWVHPGDCAGDCCNHDALNDRVLTEDAEWVWPTRTYLDQVRKTSRPEPRREEPGTT